MTIRMMIDARHREETRVAVTKGNRIEEFDFESAEHKQLKGNIYLAKVTRVEPSLQAAFVEYGGNRHGFLAFSEIHPDYYQIPKEDRDALMREEAEHAAAAALRADAEFDALEGEVEDMDSPGGDDDHGTHGDDDDMIPDADAEGHDDEDEGGDAEAGADGQADNGGENGRRGPRRDGRRGKGRGRNSRSSEDSEDTGRLAVHRRYKIQDVIRRRQVMLVQVVKEERGNKGAALTSYLSLAGRYCVLMPNTMHGGGISRKISNSADRRKLKAMIEELALPPTMGCIVRTAGMSRTKVEIKRDFDYLARLWDEIRDKTLQSSAPALVHTDSDLVKRAIRDIYHKDIEEVLVEGEEGYRAAKEFMKLLMPSHARRVKQYADPVSLYQRYGVEDQLAGMLNPVVQLKSGGYLVINPTEALVSIDINSGRSTREHNIEQTALNTNLEAAHEIARQLRLRDMAGLVVIDFIDMDHGSNVRKVERAMKDALKNDRARIQIGRISGFGLMEMSRQRLRTGVLEASTRPCPHCEGTGLVRTASSAGLSALRMIEEEAARGKGSRITLRASQEATFYLLNEKRAELRDIEELYGVRVEILADSEVEGARMVIESSGPPPARVPQFAPISIAEDDDDDDLPADEDDGDDEGDSDADDDAPRDRRPARAARTEAGGDADADGDARRPRKRRRRGRRGRRDGEEVGSEREAGDGQSAEADGASDDDNAANDAAADGASDGAGEGLAPTKPKRRRGGRNRRSAGEARSADTGATDAGDDAATEQADDQPAVAAVSEASGPAAEDAAPPKRKRAPRKAKAVVDAEAAVAPDDAGPDKAAAKVAVEADVEPAAAAPRKRATRAKKADVTDDAAPAKPAPSKPARRKAQQAEPADVVVGASADNADAVGASADNADAVGASADNGQASSGEANGGEPGDGAQGGSRRGWWQRTFGA